jgi:CO/xanthine dehydrogenase Mo-binding subunit
VNGLRVHSSLSLAVMRAADEFTNIQGLGHLHRMQAAFVQHDGYLASANGDGKSGRFGSDTKARDYSTRPVGAPFVEVGRDPSMAGLNVSRLVSVIDSGRITN